MPLCQTLNDCIFHTVSYFATKLHNSIKLMMLFPAVVMNSPNSKVCLGGERSILSINLRESHEGGKGRVLIKCNRMDG